MRIFPSLTVPVDNFVENSVPDGANARPTGLELVFRFFEEIRNLNEIKALCKTSDLNLSVVFEVVRKTFVCISQVLTAIFLLHPTANARRY